MNAVNFVPELGNLLVVDIVFQINNFIIFSEKLYKKLNQKTERLSVKCPAPNRPALFPSGISTDSCHSFSFK